MADRIFSQRIIVQVPLLPGQSKTVVVSKVVPDDAGEVGTKTVTITSCCSDSPETKTYNVTL